MVRLVPQDREGEREERRGEKEQSGKAAGKGVRQKVGEVSAAPWMMKITIRIRKRGQRGREGGEEMRDGVTRMPSPPLFPRVR